MKIEKISTIRNRFKKSPEWLLIEVTERNPHTSQSLKGRLVAHSPRRDDIFKKSITYKRHTLVAYSDDKLPKGYAAAF